MKVAVVKIGARIALSTSSTSGGTGETLSIISLLLGADIGVDVYSSISSRDISPDNFKIFEISTDYNKVNDRGYDALIVLNGNANFFGGTEDETVLLTYNIINNFKGKVFYILCDPNLTLKQIWSSVEKKPWGNKYNKEDIFVKRTDIEVLTQVHNTSAIESMMKKHLDSIASVKYYPFEKFPLYTMKNMSLPESYDKDIIYGGTFRSGKREEDMVKFYFDYPEDIRVEMFGKITADNFKQDKIKDLRQPKFSKSVKYDEFPFKMKTGISTIIIGDMLYKKIDDLAQRIYESIRIGNIVFIDSSYDRNKRVFTDPLLRDICYVESKKCITETIRSLKKSPHLIAEIAEKQRENTEIDYEEYLGNLKELIG